MDSFTYWIEYFFLFWEKFYISIRINLLYLYCKNRNYSLFTRFMVNNKIMLCRRDGRVVEGVALELLCRLLFTEGSNPSLSVSVPSPNSPRLLNTMYQITIYTIILFYKTYTLLWERFYIPNYCGIKIPKRAKKEWELDIFISAKRGQNCPNLSLLFLLGQVWRE